jgi:hypothetical protein
MRLNGLALRLAWRIESVPLAGVDIDRPETALSRAPGLRRNPAVYITA